MLQRRIGMIWTSRGCDVSSRPRTNSRADRAFLLTVAPMVINAHPTWYPSAACVGGPEPPHVMTDPQRSREHRADRNKPQQLMARDGGQTSRRDAATIGAVRLAAELAGC